MEHANPSPDAGSAGALHSTVSRRGLLTGAAAAAGVVAVTPLLGACGKSGSKGPGTTGKTDLAKLVPAYVANSSVTPDVPSVKGANGAVSDPLFLKYPTSPAKTVDGVPGKGGTYTTITPLWGAIPASAGNAYYDAVNKALGVTLKIQPSDGNNYANNLPPLFASNKLPDIIQIPGWTTTTLNFGQGVSKFKDLTPYLAGDKVKAYPNLANIPTAAWAAGVWNNKLYGLPVYPSGAVFAGTYFFRRDVFDKLGINPDSIKTADDLGNLGKELTNANGGVWAFDDLFGNDAAYVNQIYQFPARWGVDSSGKLFHKYESPQMIEALNWFSKLVKAGYVHPDAIANTNQNGKQRFWSGKSLIVTDGTGAWDGDDAKSGTAAAPSYRRAAFKLISATGNKPTIELQNAAGMYGYLNANLSDAQTKELLGVLNYIAAPYGSAEWLVVNFGSDGVDYTMVNGNPVLTERGAREVATTFQFLVTPPAATTVKSGFVQVAKDYNAWQQDTVQYAVKPLFYGMNITEPSQYASINQAVTDTINDVKFGRKPVSAYQDALNTWRKQGGDALRKFYTDIREKYGSGL